MKNLYKKELSHIHKKILIICMLRIFLKFKKEGATTDVIVMSQISNETPSSNRILAACGEL